MTAFVKIVASENTALPTIANAAMLVNLEINQWTARQHDRRITIEVADQHGSAIDAGRYHKLLINKNALGPVQTAAGAARAFHYKNTLPWSDTGYRILPATNFITYNDEIRVLVEAYQKAVRKFLDCYEQHTRDSAARLGTLYNAKEFPTLSAVEQKFGISTHFMPIPTGSDFRVTMSRATVASIQASIETRVQEATAGAMKELWTRVFLVVESMRDKLRAYKPGYGNEKARNIFRDSLVHNVSEMADILPRLNMLNDPALADIARRLKEELCSSEAEDLRKSATLRYSIADRADDIIRSMNDYVGEDN